MAKWKPNHTETSVEFGVFGHIWQPCRASDEANFYIRERERESRAVGRVAINGQIMSNLMDVSE